MAKIQKKLLMTPKSKEQLLHEQKFSGTEYDAGYIKSDAAKIRDMEMPMPLGAIHAKAMTFDTQYLNFESTRRVMRLKAQLKDSTEVEFWSGTHYEWVKCTVAGNYPITSDLTGLAHEQTPKVGKETTMTRKHGKASGAAKDPKVARAINPKTGYKEGTVGDLAGLAFLAYKTEDKRLEAVQEVVATLFKAKGKSATKEVTEPRAKHIIAVIRKEHSDLFEAAPETAKTEPKKAPKVKAKKQPVAA